MKGKIGQSTILSKRIKVLYLEYDKCPSCNSTDKINNGILRFREGKYGRFLGCSNYPNCKFSTSNIKKLKNRNEKLFN